MTVAGSRWCSTSSDGEVEGTDVSGLTVAAVADTPKVMSDGNWRLGVFIDAAASDEQAEKLGAVFSGAIGGPMEALGPLVGENLGVERAPIDVQEDGLRHSVRIGDAVDFEIEDVVPFGVETGEPAKLTGIFHPAGSELTVAHATRSKIDAFGIQYDGNVGVLDVAVLVGGVTRRTGTRSPTAARNAASSPQAFAAMRGAAGPRRAVARPGRRSPGGRPPIGWPGWTPGRAPISARSAGSWASGW